MTVTHSVGDRGPASRLGKTLSFWSTVVLAFAAFIVPIAVQAQTAPTCTTVPAAPTGFTISKASDKCASGLIFTIDAPAINDACTKEFGVFQETRLISSFPRGSRVVSIAGTPTVAHSYTVQAVNAVGRGPASPAVTYTCQDAAVGWLPMNFQATDMAVGAGKLWFINGEAIYQLTASGPQLMPGYASRIAVDRFGIAWVVNKAGNIYKWTGTTWQVMPGLAKDIGIGLNDVVWIITPEDRIAVWHPTNGWVQDKTGYGVRVSVGTDGWPWVVNSVGDVYRLNGPNGWVKQPLAAVTDISISHTGAMYAVAGPNNVIWRYAGTSWIIEPNVTGTVVAAGAGSTTTYVGSPGKPVLRKQ